jgi:probable HAF family extracellular repeat protein
MKVVVDVSTVFISTLLVLFGMVLWCGPASGVTQYTVTKLGTLGGSFGVANAINASGQVVGEAQTAGGESHAFLWEAGVMYDLGTLGGSESVAFGINDSGKVVGWAETGDWDPTFLDFYSHAFLWEGGPMQDLDFGGYSSLASDINESGHVVGSLGGYAYSWTSGMLGDLGGGYGQAWAVNELGDVVGAADTATWETHAFVWVDANDDGMPDPGETRDLGTLGGTSSFAYGINDSGQVVGEAQTAGGDTHAFLWQDDVMWDLGTVSGTGNTWALDVNSSGHVVGGGQTGAFLWMDGEMYDLNSLIAGDAGCFLAEARGINDAGQIVGFGAGGGSNFVAFLLTPVIAEPSVVGLVGLAFLVVVRRPRRR